MTAMDGQYTEYTPKIWLEHKITCIFFFPIAGFYMKYWMGYSIDTLAIR